MRGKRLIAIILCAVTISGSFATPVKAESFVLNGGRKLDTVFYANYYPDLKAKYGYDTKKLLNHYLDYGIFEGRIPALMYVNNMDLLAIGDLVPCPLLYNRASLRKKCQGYEFSTAYAAAATMVSPWVGMKRTAQLANITRSIHSMITTSVPYTTKKYHYNDPCGVFGCPDAKDDPNHGLGASCAGVTRATGLCLNILAIPYEHVNENTWAQQWCRVNLDGVYYFVDPYNGLCGPELYPYYHPLLP